MVKKLVDNYDQDTGITTVEIVSIPASCTGMVITVAFLMTLVGTFFLVVMLA